MMWLGIIIQAGILGTFLLWESYFKEKGKNLATKEDIEGITKKIELVKNEISFTKQREDAYLKERKECFINFMNEIEMIDLMHSQLITSLNSYTDINTVTKFYESLQRQIITFNQSYRMLQIYDIKSFRNDIKEIHQNVNELIEYLYDKTFTLHALSMKYNSYSNLYKENKHYIDELQEVQDEIKKFMDEYKNDKKRRKLLINYYKGCEKYTIILHTAFLLNFHQKMQFLRTPEN